MTFTHCSPERNGTQIHGRFEHWWSETGSLPLYLVPLLFPLLNFKSAVIFAKMNSIGEDDQYGIALIIRVKAIVYGIALIIRVKGTV